MNQNRLQSVSIFPRRKGMPWALLALSFCSIGCVHTSPKTIEVQKGVTPPVTCEDVLFQFQDEVVLARIGTDEITGAQLNEDTEQEVMKKWRSYCQDIQKVRAQALEHRIKIHVIESAAAKDGMELEEWLDNVQGEAIAPTEDEIVRFYNSEIPNGEPALRDIHDEVKNYLTQKNVQTHLMSKMDALLEQAAIERLMPDVSPKAIPFRNPAHAPILGVTTAPVTITVFSDFQCPYCSQIAPVIAKLVKSRPEKLRVVFRHFPLSFHENAFGAALFAQCAHAQDQFFAFHDALFEVGATFDRASLWRIAEQLNLDRKVLETCVQSDETRALIQKDMASAREIGVSGTPSIFINENEYQGARDLEALMVAVDAVVVDRASEGVQ